jgi:hypothetical protein
MAPREFSVCLWLKGFHPEYGYVTPKLAIGPKAGTPDEDLWIVKASDGKRHIVNVEDVVTHILTTEGQYVGRL